MQKICIFGSLPPVTAVLWMKVLTGVAANRRLKPKAYS